MDSERVEYGYVITVEWDGHDRRMVIDTILLHPRMRYTLKCEAILQDALRTLVVDPQRHNVVVLALTFAEEYPEDLPATTECPDGIEGCLVVHGESTRGLADAVPRRDGWVGR